MEDFNGHIPSGDSKLFVPHLIRQILSNFRGPQLLKMRTICKSWNMAVAGMPKITYKVLGSSQQSMETFRAILTPMANLHFSGLNLESEFFGNAEFFGKFSRDFCHGITSLTFEKCELPTGRLFELLAFCRRLKKLVIQMSPTMLEPDMGILHWGFCFKQVKKCFAGLTSISITENNISEKSLYGVLHDSTKLIFLKVVTEEGYLPVYSIGKILNNNAGTLRYLILRGKVHPESSPHSGLFPIDLSIMKRLCVLNLHGQNLINNHVGMLENFLNKCPALTSLTVTHSAIGKNTLSNITHNLTKLILRFNCYEDNAFNSDMFPKLQVLKMTQGPSSGGSNEALRQLLMNHYEKLHTLELQLLVEGGAFLKMLMKECFPKLKSLTLTDCINIGGPSIRHVFKNLNSLTSLSITNCSEINDQALCPQRNEKEATLAGLKDLRFLNLSGTEVGNSTVSKCLLGMDKLETVNLSCTKVNQAAISCIVNSNKPSLRKIIAQNIPCSIKKSVLKEWARIAPKVTISCPLKLDTPFGTETFNMKVD